MIERGHGYNKNSGVPMGGNAPSNNNNNNRTSFMVTPPLAPLSMEPVDQVHSPRQQRGFFSLFSRFGAKNRSLSRINTKSGDFPRLEASGSSVPSTPITPMTPMTPMAPTTPHPHVKHSLSLPVFSSQQVAKNNDQVVQSPTRAAAWEHIPFWEGCTRSIRSGSLAATTLSMETILRRNQEQKEEGTRSRRGRYLQKTHGSTKSVDLDWTTKLFVLVEGSLLQYSGDGPHDRVPEKGLQLTASSVAFASDVIPGRPWVLQVYQRAGPDGCLLPLPERRGSFISKITFKYSIKSPVTSLLLVFDGAEEMDAWMGSIRAEAVRLGGGTMVGEERETGDIEEEQTDDEYDNRHSRRYVIEQEGDLHRHESYSDETASKRTSTTYYRRSSTEAGRSFTTVTSSDQTMLDQLRGSRLSMQSMAETTFSPDTSPERSSTKYKRRSTASVSARSHSSMELKPPSLRPLSAIDRDGNLYWIPRTPSPAAPNFSLPTSLSNGHIQPPQRRTAFPASHPIPIPHMSAQVLSNRPSLSALSVVDSLPDTPPYPLPRQRHRQSSHSTPASPKIVIGLPVRPRPVSMVDTRSTSSSSPEVSISKAPIPRKHLQAGIAILPRQKSLRRKSMTAIGPSAGPPLHPPPSIPLPQLPPEPYNDDLYSSSLPSTSYLSGGPPHRRLPPPTFHQQAPKPQPQLNAYSSLGSRHSFHGVRRDRYV